MQINENIHHIEVFLAILGIMILSFIVILSNNAFGQGTLHNHTIYEMVSQSSGLDENPQIDVGVLPSAIRSEENLGKAFVANSDSNTVSVLSMDNNTKIKDIPVGNYPIAIEISQVTNTTADNKGTAYVANSDSNTVSVLSMYNNTKIKDIPVGNNPTAIGIDEFSGTVYVANSDSNTVSVIDGKNDTKIGEDIPVGNYPIAIEIDQKTGTVYVANSDSNTVSVIDGKNDTKIGEDIPVGNYPIAIEISQVTNTTADNKGTVYVANSDSNTVSVISMYNNTKIKDIPVGNNPTAIGIDEFSGTVYVANSDSNTVSVISIYNNTKIKDIPVGNNPTAIGIDEFSGTVYVANSDSNTVSVIDGKNDTKIGEDIPVGNYPIAIGIDEYSDTVYVANSDSNGISVIDGTAHKAVAGIILEVNPLDSGYIVCDGLTPPSSMEQYIYVWSGAECIAKPNEGFEFVSWEQNLGNNSTQLINVSRSASTLDSFVLGIQDLFGDKPEEPEAKLNVTKFGTFTANFKELPPPVPQEFWLQSYVLVGTVIAGLSIPSVVVFITSKRDAKKLNYYHKQIASLYEDGRLDKGDLEPLDRLRSIVANAYSEGKLNEKHYESLEGEISTLYEEIFRKKIAALDSNNNYSVSQETHARTIGSNKKRGGIRIFNGKDK